MTADRWAALVTVGIFLVLAVIYAWMGGPDE